MTLGEMPIRHLQQGRLLRATNIGGERTPRLRAIERNGRLAVVFSSLDLGVGLVGQPVAGVIWYEPQTATALVARLLHQHTGQ